MNMKMLCGSLLAMVFGLHAWGQQYSVLLIPDSLRKGSKAVVRHYESVLEIESKSKARYRRKVAYTLLSSRSAEMAQWAEGYDKFHDIRSMEGAMYDALGKKIKSTKKGDIQDVSGMGGGTEVSDDRLKVISFYNTTYPYTVEFESEVELNGLMFLPTWVFMPDEAVSVEHASLRVINKSGIPVQFRNFNLPAGAIQPAATAASTTELIWEVKNMKPFIAEPYSPPAIDFVPVVMLAMQDFSIAGKEGSNSSWDKFGSFVYSLTAGRDALPPDLKSKVAQLVADKPDTYSKVAALYQYLQQNTRYISIQLGIGGWQPFDAAFVHQKKYGDCKALTNFMYSLLREAGIPSVYSLIRAGKYAAPVLADYPGSQFNHVILCVPNGSDSIWLECTSQDLPAGYLGDFTSNRYALLVKPEGSKLVRTPNYSAQQNTQLRRADARLAADGSLSGKVHTTYSGMQYDDVQYLANHLTEEKKKEHYDGAFDLGTYTIDQVTLEPQRQRLPAIDERFVLQVRSYAQVTGKRLLLNPNLLLQTQPKMAKDTTRKYDLFFNHGYTDTDSVRIEVGKDYQTESMPRPVKLESTFGTYTAEAKFVDGVLYYFRHYQTREGRYPLQEYNKYVDFLNAVGRADRSKVVLVKTGG